MPSAVPTLAGVAAPGAAPIVPSAIVTAGMTDGDDACTAVANAIMFMPLLTEVDCTLRVWVSAWPHRKPVIWRAAGSVANGVSGPMNSGCAVPLTRLPMPGLCQAKFGLLAW